MLNIVIIDFIFDYTLSGRIIWSAAIIKSSHYTLQVYYHNVVMGGEKNVER